MSTTYDASEVAVPKMSHPDSKQSLDVDADQVPMYESQGWTTKSGKS